MGDAEGSVCTYAGPRWVGCPGIRPDYSVPVQAVLPVLRGRFTSGRNERPGPMIGGGWGEGGYARRLSA